jgi:hypothetical protein
MDQQVRQDILKSQVLPNVGRKFSLEALSIDQTHFQKILKGHSVKITYSLKFFSDIYFHFLEKGWYCQWAA